MLWVVARSPSRERAPPSRACSRWPKNPTLEHLEAVVLATKDTATGPSGSSVSQLWNSVSVSTGDGLRRRADRDPTAYALARFRFVGKEGGVRALLATQMFPTVASAIPLYLLLSSSASSTR
jgi:arabinogalactan oligomer/maltooligosaccharide transport system permease protein